MEEGDKLPGQVQVCIALLVQVCIALQEEHQCLEPLVGLLGGVALRVQASRNHQVGFRRLTVVHRLAVGQQPLCKDSQNVSNR